MRPTAAGCSCSCRASRTSECPAQSCRPCPRGALGSRPPGRWGPRRGASPCDPRSAPLCRSGRPTFFTAVFSTFTPAAKESWLSSLQLAKLALGKSSPTALQAGIRVGGRGEPQSPGGLRLGTDCVPQGRRQCWGGEPTSRPLGQKNALGQGE